MKVLLIMRGLPGSGKSYLASSYGGKVVSADQYFERNGKYNFQPSELAAAHAYSIDTASRSMEESMPLVIIDNTNIFLWEIQPYAVMAEKFGYAIAYGFPTSDWANDPVECYKRNSHGVPLEAIQRMWENYERGTHAEMMASKKLF